METRVPISEQIFGHNKAPLEAVLANDFKELAGRVDAAVAKITKRPAKVKDETDFAAVGALVLDARKLSSEVEETRKGETDPMFKAQREIKAHFDALVDKLAAALKPHQTAADDYTREKAAAERRKNEEEAKKLREKEDAERLKAENSTGATAARAEGRAEVLASQAEAKETAAGQGAASAVRTKVGGGGVATARTKWAFAIDDYAALIAPMGPLGPFIKREAIEAAVRSVVNIQKGDTRLSGVRVYPDTKASFR